MNAISIVPMLGASPEPFLKIGTVILVLLTVVVLINILLGLDGRAFIRF